MSISPQHFVKQLKDRHPEWRDDNGEWYDDKTIYGMGRNRYKDAPVVDWPDAGWRPKTPKTTIESMEEQYKKLTSESNFLDYLDYGLGDEDDWYVTRLAYSMSMQGLLDDAIRGNQRFTFERQPKIWEEAIGGALSFFMPLDFATMALGGGVIGKFAVGAGKGAIVANKAGQLVQKGYVHRATNQLVKMGLKKDVAESAITKMITAEATFIPYEAAKSNLSARIQHIRDPENHPEPLSSSEIWKETFAGAAHGAVIGAAVGFGGGFMSGQHARALRGLEAQGIKSSLKLGKPLEPLKLTNMARWTGKFPQFATEIAGLNLADFTAQGAIHNQWKDFNQIVHDGIVSVGMIGSMKLGATLFSNTVGKSFDNIKIAYKEHHLKRRNEMDAFDNVQRNIRKKSEDQNDSSAEASKTNDSINKDANYDFQSHQEFIKNFEQSEPFIRVNKLESQLNTLIDKIKTYSKSPETLKDIQNDIVQFKKLTNQLIGEIDNAGYKGSREDLSLKIKVADRWDKLIDERMRNLVDSKATRLTELQTRLLTNNQKTILVKGKKVKVMDLTEDQIEFAEAAIKGLDLGGPKVSKKITMDESETIKLQKTSDELRSKADKQINPDLKESYENVARKIDELNTKRDKDLEDPNLTPNQKDTLSENQELIKTYSSTRLTEKMQKRGAAAGAEEAFTIDIDTQNKYIDALVRLSDFISKGKIPTKLNKISLNDLTSYIRKNAGDKAALSQFYQWLDAANLLTKELSIESKKLFGIKKIGIKKQATGLGAGELDLKKGGVNTQIITSSKSQAGKVFSFVREAAVKGLAKFGGGLKSILQKVQKLPLKAINTKTGEKLSNLFVYKEGKNVFVLNQPVFNRLAKFIFGKGTTGSRFRKSLLDWVESKYGKDSNEFILVDKFILGHAKIKGLKPQQQAYLAKYKDLDAALPVLEKIQKEFVGLVFNNVKSKQLSKMPNKQLKKYGISKEMMDFPEGMSIFRLKKGFEVLENLIKGADKEGFLKIGNMEIHKDVLRGVFRFLTETAARPNEVLGGTSTLLSRRGIPHKTTLTKAQQKLMELVEKELKPEQIEELIELDYLTPKENGKFQYNIRFKVGPGGKAPLNGDSTLSPIISKKSLIGKAAVTLKRQFVDIKGESKQFTRSTLGNVQYETLLSKLWEGLGFGKELINSSNTMGAKRYSLTNLGKAELYEVIDIINKNPELVTKLSNNPMSAHIARLQKLRDVHDIPMDDSIAILKLLGVKNGEINNITSTETVKIAAHYFNEYPRLKDPMYENPTELAIALSKNATKFAGFIPGIRKFFMPIWYVLRQAGPGGKKLANLLLDYDVTYTRDKGYAENAIWNIKHLLHDNKDKIIFISPEMRNQRGRILTRDEKTSIAAFDLKNKKTGKRWSSVDAGYDKLSDFQKRHILAREWHTDMTEYFWHRTAKEVKGRLSVEKYNEFIKTFNKKYIENYMTRALNPAVVKAIGRNGINTRFIQEITDVELRRVAREKASENYKKGTDAYKAEYDKHMKDSDLRTEVLGEVYDIMTNAPQRIVNVYFKERGLLLPYKIKVEGAFGRTKEVVTYSEDYGAIMDRYSTVTSKFIATVRYFPEFTNIGAKFKVKGDAKALFTELSRQGDIGAYAAKSFARILGLNESITGLSPEGNFGHRFLGAASTLSAATGLSSPTSGVKNLLIGLPRAVGSFGIINTAIGVTRLFNNYSELMTDARKKGYEQFANKSLGLAEKKPIGLFKKVPWLKDFSMEQVFKWNLMTKTEGWARIISVVAGNLQFNQLLDAYHGKKTIIYKMRKREIERQWRDTFKLSDKEIDLLKNTDIRRIDKGMADPEMISQMDFIHAKVTHYAHVSTQGGTSPQLLPLWMSNKYARPLTLFYRMAASNSSDMYLNHVKPIVTHANIMPLARTTLASSLSGAALWGMYDMLFDVKNPTENEGMLAKVLSFLWRAEYLQLFSDAMNPYGNNLFLPYLKGSKGPEYLSYDEHMMFSNFNPIMGAAITRNIMSASLNLMKWNPMAQAGRAVGMDWSGFVGDPHKTGKQSLDDFLKTTFVLYGQFRKNYQISPKLYASDELSKGRNKYMTYANKFRKKVGLNKGSFWATTTRTPYYRSLKDAFFANNPKEFTRAYWVAYNYITTSLVKDATLNGKANLRTIHKKALESINASMRSLSPAGVSESFNEQLQIYPDREFKKYIGKDIKEYELLQKKFGYRLRTLMNEALNGKLSHSSLYDRM